MPKQTLGQRIGFPGSEPAPAAKPAKSPRNPLNMIADAYNKRRAAPVPKDDVPELNKKSAAAFVKGFK